MAITFDILNYLSGLTNFVFEKDVLVRVAFDCGVSDVVYFSDITEEVRDKCEIALLETIVYGSPNGIASVTNQHGAFTQTVGSQTVTKDMVDNIRLRLKYLYNKYGYTEKTEMLNSEIGTLSWINENDNVQEQQ